MEVNVEMEIAKLKNLLDTSNNLTILKFGILYIKMEKSEISLTLR